MDNDHWACETLRLNRPQWNVIEGGLEEFDGRPYHGIDLVAGGLPCPPFSIAGKKLGEADERNMFPHALRIISEVQPRAVLIENVRGLLDPKFAGFREWFDSGIRVLGYTTHWALLNASDFGVPQLRPRVAFVALEQGLAQKFAFPAGGHAKPPTVGEALMELMAACGWEDAAAWAAAAGGIAPTIVGGSKKHGGPDLGPTRAKRAWAALGVDGHGIADSAPVPGFAGLPKLTARMVARLQGFPDCWEFAGRKTQAYRQIGNAFPPPLARAVGEAVANVLSKQSVLRKVG